MKIVTAWSTDPEIEAVIKAYDCILTKLGAKPDLLMLYCSVSYDLEAVVAKLREHAPDVQLYGGTSCIGVMTQSGFHSKDGHGLAMCGVLDPEGRYGVGAARLNGDPRKTAQYAVIEALKQAGCSGEVPAMVWMTAAPGCEEALIAGIADVVGDMVPVTGGSTADNTVSGEWKQFANDRVFSDAVVVTVLFPSTEVMFAFHSGYEPTGMKGTVTKADGRLLVEIDGRPAAKVYNEWIGGMISTHLEKGGNILASTTLHPLGRVAGHVGEIPYYQLSHPDAVTDTGALTLFTHISSGEELVLMRGTQDSLISRAGRVASSALETYSSSPHDVAGALVVYCAGCMLTVQDRIDEVVDSLREVLPTTPFMGIFTFGEQGCFVGGKNHHGNLMISVLLFRK